MKTLSREGIQRMVDGEGLGSGGGSGGFDPSILSGFAQQSWVEENFVSIEWFDAIFQVFDDTTKLEVNGELPVDTSKLNIKAMFGFWTDFYISALGNGGQVGASIYLSSLADVNVAGVTNGQVLTWNSAQSKWIATTPSSGVDMTTVWNALAASTSQQINASHLTTALTGYATTTWVNNQGFATQNWVQSQGYLTQHQTVNGTFWGNSWTNGGNLTGDITVSQIYIGYSNEINNKDNGVLYLQYRGSGDLNLCNNGGNLVIGTDDIVCGHSETLFKYTSNGSTQYTDPAPGDDYNFKFGGSLAATYLGARYGIVSQGYVTALSDEREKNIIEHFELPLDYIAKAPMVSYEWKDKEKRGEGQHVGSIAQYWLRELPELVPEFNDRYTMDHGCIALLCAITDARHIVNLEQRVARLERRILNN